MALQVNLNFTIEAARGSNASAISPIDVFSMHDFQHQDGDPFVLNIANRTVIANPISPQSAPVAVKRLAALPRIVSGF
jgi:hypothetical protein